MEALTQDLRDALQKSNLPLLFNHVINEQVHDPSGVRQTITDKPDLIQQFPERFDGNGRFEGEYKITLDLNVPALVHPPRVGTL